MSTALVALEPAELTLHTLHEPYQRPDGWLSCVICGGRGLCGTYRRHLQSVADNNGDRMRAHALVIYLRLIANPRVRNRAPEWVHAQLMGWIDDAVTAQQRLEEEMRRRAVAVSTGAQRAVERITIWAANHGLARLTPNSGLRTLNRKPSGE
jgi:hypothetical protein